MIRLTLATLLVCFALPSQAQEATPADIESIDALLIAAYEVISGPADEERDWDRFRAMYHPEGRLIPTGRRPGGERVTTPYTADEYAELAAEIFRTAPLYRGRGFYETQVNRRVELYGDIAHVWSTYESRFDPSDEEPYQRGINTFQLYHDGTSWKILSLVWEAETADTPIPADYLPDSE